MGEGEAKRCSSCGKEAAKRCPFCSDRFYCSRECQLVDWKEKKHKKLCRRDLDPARKNAQENSTFSQPTAQSAVVGTPRSISSTLNGSRHEESQSQPVAPSAVFTSTSAAAAAAKPTTGAPAHSQSFSPASQGLQDIPTDLTAAAKSNTTLAHESRNVQATNRKPRQARISHKPPGREVFEALNLPSRPSPPSIGQATTTTHPPRQLYHFAQSSSTLPHHGHSTGDNSRRESQQPQQPRELPLSGTNPDSSTHARARAYSPKVSKSSPLVDGAHSRVADIATTTVTPESGPQPMLTTQVEGKDANNAPAARITKQSSKKVKKPPSGTDMVPQAPMYHGIPPQAPPGGNVYGYPYGTPSGMWLSGYPPHIPFHHPYHLPGYSHGAVASMRQPQHKKSSGMVASIFVCPIVLVTQNGNE